MDDKQTNSYNLPFKGLIKPDNTDDLTCIICLGVCFRPIVLNCCQHLVCLYCIKEYSIQKDTCPYCRKYMEFQLPMKLIIRLFDNLTFYCPYKENGCNQEIRYSTYFEHIVSCSKISIESPYTTISFCQKCQKFYSKKESNHICNKDLNNDGNKLIAKLLELEYLTDEEESTVIDGVKVPNFIEKTKYSVLK